MDRTFRHVAALCALCACLGASAAVKTFKEGYIDKSLVETSGEPQAHTGKFWGYRTAKDGPGDDAFARLIEKAKKEHVPVVAVWSNKDCVYCSRFVARLNEAKEEVAAKLKETHALFAWFKGAGGKSHPLAEHGPAACKAAYDFATAHGAKPPWPFAIYYYCAPDGKETVRSFSLGLFSAARFLASAGNFARMCAKTGGSGRDAKGPGGK